MDGPYAMNDYVRIKIQQGRDFINATHAKIREVLYKILALLFSSSPAGFVEGVEHDLSFSTSGKNH